jgi:hypothetical protein
VPPHAASSALNPVVALSAKNFRRLICVPAMGKPPFPDRAFVYPRSIDLPLGFDHLRSIRQPGSGVAVFQIVKAQECG